jgi:cytochrome bd-type quinol oxidase subunit 2
MLLWLESQTTVVIALIVFALCYTLAAIVFFAVNRISQRPIAEQLNATTPVMLTPLALIAGLLIAFLANESENRGGRVYFLIGGPTIWADAVIE